MTSIFTGKSCTTIKLIFEDMDEANEWLTLNFPDALQGGSNYHHTVDIFVTKRTPLEALALQADS